MGTLVREFVQQSAAADLLFHPRRVIDAATFKNICGPTSPITGYEFIDYRIIYIIERVPLRL